MPHVPWMRWQRVLGAGRKNGITKPDNINDCTLSRTFTEPRPLPFGMRMAQGMPLALALALAPALRLYDSGFEPAVAPENLLLLNTLGNIMYVFIYYTDLHYSLWNKETSQTQKWVTNFNNYLHFLTVHLEPPPQTLELGPNHNDTRRLNWNLWPSGGAERWRGTESRSGARAQLRRTLMAIIMRQQQLHHRKEGSQGSG